MPRRTLIIAGGGLLAFLAACTPSRHPTYSDPAILLQDDFSQPTSGWDAYSDSEKTANYDNGQYLIAVEQTGVDVWGLPGLDLTDLRLEVDTQYAAGPVDNEFGVMCRYTRDGDKHSFYFFFISSDGYYAMGKVIKNQRTVLNPASGDYRPSDAIQQDQSAINHLSATCAGKKMSFAVNDTPVGEFEDADLTHGDIGLIAGTLLNEGGVKIHFDNLVVRKP
jgi:hypothetical protein